MSPWAAALQVAGCAWTGLAAGGAPSIVPQANDVVPKPDAVSNSRG
jgi:hypothetical protein